ncbi:hypothetical protein OIDMADRAFT_60890 [Oidiodendron maius Zn]|uniref:Peptidase S33 tripeptidyl aminopeptidase-like C-terminal domain-containing protein n=1 Tax=Oidiodendron maius (strain Zn) TaxID=913774 RepID=A0A0C3CWH7_OIDMZ|nr:hypothetical protein OIDMADRAFT_60890 [Oidiodendron maius Zn]
MDGEIRQLENESWVGGELWAANFIDCTGWSIQSDYRFAGPFGTPTSNPILFVNPIAPIENGQKATSLFPGSQLLTIDGTGHTSSGPYNTCGFSKMNAYLQYGTLPGSDNYCALEIGPFNVTYIGSLSKRGDVGMIEASLKGLARKRNIPKANYGLLLLP